MRRLGDTVIAHACWSKPTLMTSIPRRASEPEALTVEDKPGKLPEVGYWSVRSYLFRYLETDDWIWSRHATSSYLDAFDELAASRNVRFLSTETKSINARQLFCARSKPSSHAALFGLDRSKQAAPPRHSTPPVQAGQGFKPAGRPLTRLNWHSHLKQGFA
jgi:hypothetical protein